VYGIAKITKHTWNARAPYSIYNTNHKRVERERKTIEARLIECYVCTNLAHT